MSLKVLHCPTCTAGNPIGMAKGERALGLESQAVSLKANRTLHGIDEVLLSSKAGLFSDLKARYRLFQKAKNDFDVIHFNFGQSLVPNFTKRVLWPFGPLLNSPFNFFELMDLPFLKKAGKKIFVTFQGSDARQDDYCLKNFEINFVPSSAKSPAGRFMDNHKRWRINKINNYADKIYYLNPDLKYVLPKEAEFLPYSCVDYRDWQFCPPSETLSKPLIMHAPTHQEIKGTKYIIEAVERLKKEDYEFDFELVNLPYNEAMERYKKADLIIDQLLAGWYGGFATEAMAMGKPVICYIRERDLKFIPEGMRSDMPIINATPQTIYSVLKSQLKDLKQLYALGCKGRSYVEKWHDPIKIAQKLKIDYMKKLVE